MSTINVQCTDQVLAITNSPVIASGGINENEIQFSFCSKWDGYAKICVFYRQTGNYYYSLIDSNDRCSIPAECCTSAGKIYFGVVGTKDNVTRTSEVLAYQIVEGAVTTIDDPTPDIYQQILNELAAIREILEKGQMDINGLTAETALADDDCFPFYDASESANRKTLWSNIVDKIRAAAAKHTHDAANITSGTLDAERIPAIDGSKITDGTVALAKLASDAKYWDEEPRTNDSSKSLSYYMTASWGHIFNWCWGVNHYFQFDFDELNRCDNFWETIVYGANDIELVFQNPDSSNYMKIMELNKRTNTVAKEVRITVPQYRFVHIKKIAGEGLLLSGNYDSRYISSGTAAPTDGSGSDGDIYLKYEEA